LFKIWCIFIVAELIKLVKYRARPQAGHITALQAAGRSKFMRSAAQPLHFLCGLCRSSNF